MVQEDAQAAYDRREEELTPEIMRELERRVVLSVLDRKWREHLYEMDYLREGIGLRGMAQRDPLVEYQREGFDMFSAMMEGIKEESVGNLFNLQVEVQENPIVEEVGAGAQLAFGGSLPGVTAARRPRPGRRGRPGRDCPGARRRRSRSARGPAPPSIPEPAAPPAAFGKRPAGATRKPAELPSGGQPERPSGQQPGGRARGRHAADGRGHATAAGRGQAATRSGGAHGRARPPLPRRPSPSRPGQPGDRAPAGAAGGT